MWEVEERMSDELGGVWCRHGEALLCEPGLRELVNAQTHTHIVELNRIIVVEQVYYYKSEGSLTSSHFWIRPGLRSLVYEKSLHIWCTDITTTIPQNALASCAERGVHESGR